MSYYEVDYLDAQSSGKQSKAFESIEEAAEFMIKHDCDEKECRKVIPAENLLKGTIDSIKRGDLDSRCVKAAVKFLKSCNFEILDTDYSTDEGGIDIIAKDGNDLVFVLTKHCRIDDGFPLTGKEASKTRLKAELVSLDYHAENPYLKEMHVRFDLIAVTPTSGDQALLRHHVNAFAVTKAA